MRVFKDVLTGDELASDSFPLKEIDDIVYEVEAKMIQKVNGDFGISANTDEDAESSDAGGLDSNVQTVNNVVEAHKLVETTFDKKSYMMYIKGYMKALTDHLKANNPSRVDAFQKGAQNFVKKVLANFSDFRFFQGETMDIEKGMVALMFYREDGITPVFYIWKDGIIQEKY